MCKPRQEKTKNFEKEGTDDIVVRRRQECDEE